MEKLLRILFVMSAIAFVTTVTACADDNKTAKTGGDAKTAINPGFFKFTAEANGVTIDESKDVYKITINPSLLNYFILLGNPPVPTFAPAKIFTVTFTDDKQGFIIPTTVDKAEALATTHKADLNAAISAAFFNQGASNNVTHSFLADNPGFAAIEINADWSTLAPRTAVVDASGGIIIPFFPGIPNIISNSKVKVICITTMTGINKDSFLAEAPDAANDLAIAKGTKTVCKFSLVAEMGIDDDAKTVAYKAWAEAVVAAAKDDSTKNIQKMGFVGIVTGDDTASAITKAAGTLLNADITAATSAKLVKAYKTSFQKVEIVIAPVK